MERIPNTRHPQSSQPPMAVVPQEIVNLIVDEVASHLQSSTETRRAALSTLKACALVSNSFRQQARRHLFLQIHIRVNTRGRKHAGRLQSLGVAESDGIVHSIRTLTLTVDLLPNNTSSTIPSSNGPAAIAHRPSWRHILRILDTLRSRNTDTVGVIDALSTACLDNLEIVGKRPFYVWNSDHKASLALSRICAKETLKSLQLNRILSVPRALLMDAIRSIHLHILSLSQISIANRANHPEAEYGRGASSGQISYLRQLEATGFSCSALFEILRCNNDASTRSFFVFPHLRQLAVSVPTLPSDMDELWQFLQHVSPTLEILELQQYKWSMHDVLSSGPFCLSALPSLRCLKLCTTSFDIGKNFCSKQEMIARSLASDTAANTLTSITIDIHVHRSTKQIRRDSDLTWRDLGPISGWEAIDTALSISSFPNLKQFVFNVKLFYFVKDSDSLLQSGHKAVIPTQHLLPNITTASSISTELSLHVLCSHRPFLDYFNVL